MSSPVSELLVQESLCTDLFKTISESIEVSSHANSEVLSSVNYSDDVIGELLDRMIQILPPEERNIFGFPEGKNIEEIIQEANELIRATTPLFSSDSGEKSWNLSSKALIKKSKNSEEESNIKDHSEEVTSSRDKSENDSICSSLESILVKDNVSNTTLGDQAASSFRLDNLDKNEKNNENYQNISEGDELVVNIVNKVPLTIDEMEVVKTLENTTSGILHNIPSKMNENLNSSDNKSLSIKHNLETFSEQSNGANSQQGQLNWTNTMTNHGGVLVQGTTEVEKSSEVSPQSCISDERELESLELVRQKYIAEIKELKLSHNKEIYGLAEKISNLNNKIYEMQKHTKTDKSPDLKDQQLERLESEIKSQEQLLTGYERENKKLCKEISTFKEVWKQRENKLIEEKQKLHNELQGMVSKSTTEALQEQLKDARETIVKLQIELTTCKSKKKELEVTCERLHSEIKHLQEELGNCRDETVSRRDKYPFLASSNVGMQIQELKNIISRKDIEIAQMNTAVGILKGELSNRALNLPSMYNQQLEMPNLTTSQLQAALAVEHQNAKDLVKEKELLLKENLDLKRQVRELECIVKRRQRSDSCFPVNVSEVHSTSRLSELEKELCIRQESLSTLHSQFMDMQKKYEIHIQELEDRLKECKEELQTLKVNQKKEEANQSRANVKKFKQGGAAVVKEETHLLATIRGLRQEAATREKEMNKLNKEIEDVRQTNKRLQKEREKQLNSMPIKMAHIKEKANLRKVEKTGGALSNSSTTSSNNNINPLLFTELQESNLMLKSKTKNLQEEVKRLEQDLITMHNKRVHDLNMLQNEHDLEITQLIEERAALLSQSSTPELQGQIYTQQMVINHLKNRLKQMEELKGEVTLLRAERDNLEESLDAVNKKMCFLQNAQSPESMQYKTLLEKLETLEKNQEIREQKLNAVRELLCRSTQGQGHCSGTCRDKLLDKKRQICYYRAQMDRILEALLEIRRTK